ncbi:MAG: hypothetical protein KJ058_15830, partial [Thermoanaerobaculia bacterium]|nr:hypothetical protein [Thermoanaerobaculia bacterium]
PAGRWRRAVARRPLAAAGVVLLAVAVGVLVAALPPSSERAGTAADASTFLGVSVPPFANRTAEPALDPLGAMAADAIRSELPRLDFLRRPRGHATPVAADAPAHTRVTGTYYLDGEQLRFTATIAGAGGEVLHAIEPTTGPRATPGAAIELARQRVLGALAAVLDPRFMPGPRSRPPLYDAYREFMAGVHLFGVDYDAAIPHFERALAIDPEFFGALNVLATSHGNRGDREAQRRVLARAASMRHRLTQAERLTLDWSLAEADGRYPDALQAIRRRAELEPEHELVRYLHAFYALRLNRPQESIAASDRFDHGFWDSGPRGDWAWASRTDARHLLDRHEEELALARQARERHPSSLLARGSEAAALAALGRIGELRQALDDALTIEGGPVQNPGLLLRAAAAELAIHGRPEAAAEIAARAVAWYRSRPPKALDRPEVRLGLGRALYLAGRWEEAAAVARELLATAPGDFRHLELAGLAAARSGDAGEARRLAAELAALSDERGEVFLTRARLAALLGKREQALDLLRDGVARGVFFGVGLHRDLDLATLRGWPPYEELMRPKG